MKSKTLHVILFVFMMGMVVQGQTPIGGDVYGQMTIEYSPYLVQDTLYVPPGETLLIDPGVEIRFQGDYELFVYGTIIANGTETDSIYFVRDSLTHDRWGGIRLWFSAPGCSLTYCRIEDGFADKGGLWNEGGAIRINGNSPYISDCLFVNNTSVGSGGAIYLFNDNGTINHCTFVNNQSSQNGGAITVDQAHPNITNCEFRGNRAIGGGAVTLNGINQPMLLENNVFDQNLATTDNGGALWIAYSSVDISVSNNTFSGNTSGAGTGGGAIFMIGTHNIHLDNNLFYSNQASSIGGAIATIDVDSTNVVMNNTIHNNSANYGGAIAGIDTSTMKIINSVMWGNNAAVLNDEIFTAAGAEFIVQYSDVAGGFTGTGNISSNPMFADAVNADYHFDGDSPLVDAGTNDGAPSIDFEGHSRPIDGDGNGTATVDIGAFEYDPEFVAPIITGQAQALSTPEETELTITLSAVSVTDPDNIFPDDFTLNVQNGSDYTRNGNAITPVTDFNGDLTVPVTVNDGVSNSNVFNLTVSVTAVNDVPVISGQAQTLSTEEETSLDITFSALTVTDPDDTYPDDFTLSVQNGSDYSRSGNTITPATDFNGDLVVPVIVNDGSDNSNTFNLTVSVSPVNDVPQITEQGTITTEEETDLTITFSDLTVIDPDDTYPDDFSLSVLDGTDYTRTGNTITPNDDFNGDLTVPVIVNDGTDDSNTFNLTVSVTPVNDPPSITGQGTLSTAEETELTISLDDLTVIDVDNIYPDDFTMVVGDNINYTHTGPTITPVANFNGDLTVPVTVNDGSDDSNTYNLTVSVTPVNDVPVITGQSSLITQEDVAITIILSNLVVTDPDNIYPDEFTLIVSDGENYSRVGNTITPTLNFNGDLTVPVTVYDGADTSASYDLTVSVTPVSDVPTITGQVALSTPEENELTITLDDLIVSDIDNTYPDDFSLTVEDGAHYSRVGNAITPETDYNGNLTVPVYVNDGTSNSNTYNLNVSVSPVNDAPIITGQSTLSTAEETALTIILTDLTVTDVDNTYPTGFTLTVQDGDNYTRSNNTITPVANFNGDLTVPVMVNDGSDNSNTYDLLISVTGVNDLPVITGQSTLTTAEETALTITLGDLTVTDEDNNYPDDFTLVVRDGANYMRVNNTITPMANFNGDLTVPVVVNDGSDDSEEYSLIVTVEGVNDPPVFAASRQSVAFNEDDSLTYTLMELSTWVEDPDNPDSTLIFTAEGGEFLSVNLDSPQVSIKADANWFGIDSVEIYVSDGELMDTTKIIVDVMSVNDVPVITGVDDSVTFVNTGNKILTMNNWVVDNDLPNDSLRWEFSVSDPNLLYGFDPRTSNLTLIATDFIGEAMLRFTVSDDSAATATDSVRVVVTPDPLSIDNLETQIPIKYELSQNYPNPFNPITTIKFGVPKAGKVTIIVFNILGQKVDTILDDFTPAGYHTITFDAGHLSTGIYFYAIHTQEFYQVKKMILLK